MGKPLRRLIIRLCSPTSCPTASVSSSLRRMCRPNSRMRRCAASSMWVMGATTRSSATRPPRRCPSCELRSRWVRIEDGSWRVFSVRNIPDTPPWMDITGPSPDGLDTPHWEALRAGKLELQRCRQFAVPGRGRRGRSVRPATRSTWAGRKVEIRRNRVLVDPDVAAVYSGKHRTPSLRRGSRRNCRPLVDGGSWAWLAHADGITPRIGDAVCF